MRDLNTPQHVITMNGGRVEQSETCTFRLSPGVVGYADAQIDDYGGRGGAFHWRPGTRLSLRARFSHNAATLQGAAWFFFASAPSDLPFAPEEAGRGWFAGTIDVRPSVAAALLPLSPAVLLLNRIAAARRRIWPGVRRRLGIHASPIAADMTAWHEYRLEWRTDGTRFLVDGAPLLMTPQSPRGPLGFVCWLDNQYLVLTPHGRFRAGTLHTGIQQWMEIADLRLDSGD